MHHNNLSSMRGSLRRFDFETLFVEDLGWDVLRTRLPLAVDGETFVLEAVAEKRGLVAFVCQVTGDLPAYGVRRKIDHQVAQRHREHFIIYVDGARTEQVWQWVLREPGRPLASREHRYRPAEQSGESLLQKLQLLYVALEEEEDLTLTDVAGRVRAAFNVERATRRFFDRFRQERTAFEKFVEGIPDADMSKWYVSVMLNRLMFVYFIQKKGFLDGDPDYLRNRMRAMQRRHGDDQFYSFYRYFLLRLFHEGLGEPDRDAELERLIGKVPYLNGGIFQEHEVERAYGDIEIGDAAFERIFDFFDQYQWHLDDRPLRDDREINPDVLGYIFEKYINQKQMGAYYTKEDITEYISKNTIIPFLFDQARKDCAIAFEGRNSVWRLAQADPDRYIYPAVRKGADLPLPEEIAAGIDDVAQRGDWNTPTPDAFALPTEIWRETVARRQRYAEIRAKLEAGELTEINDFITYNLDIQQFAQDVVENSEGPELLRAFWKAIRHVSVLDPTCGSGAFLFAALNILQPLYEGCLERMAGFVADLGPEDHPQKFHDFKATLAQVAQHPNPTYFVLKSIVINNLYGVDIMAEAVEIAKLRLFLKLVAQVARVEDIEPLPDIDFNIRTGNTLVGFTSKEEVARAMRQTQTGQGKLMFGEDQAELVRIEEKAVEVDRHFTSFREMQVAGDLRPFGARDFVESKQKLQARLGELESELNRYLAKQHGINPRDVSAFRQWQLNHQPFHWFIEFYGIYFQGGFDVVIGNPPYVEYAKVKKEYSVRGYSTEKAGNLYAFVMERTLKLITEHGYSGMIVPLSGHSTDRMKPLIDNFYLRASQLHLFNISADANPSILFPGVKFRLAIYIHKLGPIDAHSQRFSTRYTKWYAGARDTLFENIHYELIDSPIAGSIPKISNLQQKAVLDKLGTRKGSLAGYKGKYKIYYHNTPVSWIRAHPSVPYFFSERDGEKRSTQLKPLSYPTIEHSMAAFAVLCSSLFFMWYITSSDCYHLNKREVSEFPIDLDDEQLVATLLPVAERLNADMLSNTRRRVYVYKTSGRVEYDEFYPKLSKSIIDEVDRILASHYAFTEEEIDFISNFEIKYRMGDELFDDED